jgi:ferritin-like metal-binding protein YciE
MAGIIEEGLKTLDRQEVDGAVCDAGLIASAQKAEHYEMSSYGTCVAWARTLGLHQIAARLEATLEEEKAVDRALTDIAVQAVNISAIQEAT